jgi:hypothetical protein
VTLTKGTIVYVEAVEAKLYSSLRDGACGVVHLGGQH